MKFQYECGSLNVVISQKSAFHLKSYTGHGCGGKESFELRKSMTVQNLEFRFFSKAALGIFSATSPVIEGS